MRAARPLALAAAALLLAGCGGSGGTGDAGFIPGNGGVVEYDVKDREAVDPIEGETLQGEPVSLKELADGKPAVVNVWGSWCAPCRAEARDLQKASVQLKGEAAFLGISIRDSNKARPLAFQRTFGVTYPSLWDPDGRALLAFPGSTATRAIPSTIVVDSQGRVSAFIVGEVPSVRTLVELVEDAG